MPAGLGFHGSNTENNTIYFMGLLFKRHHKIIYMKVKVLGKLLEARYILLIVTLRLL